MTTTPRRAFAWSSASSAVVRILSFVATLFTARLLAPEDFGIAAVVTAIIVFAEILTELGVAPAIVQKPNATRVFASTAFWTNQLAGFCLGVWLIVLGPILGSFYAEPKLPVLLATASAPFFLSIGAVPLGLLQRDMRFARIGVVEVGSTVAGSVTAVVLAFGGYGTLSLVVGAALRATLRNALFFWASGWRPELAFDRQSAIELWAFSRGIAGFNVINYWGRNLDTLLLARTVGQEALGVYNRAYNLMLLPVNLIGSSVQQVLLPILSRASPVKRSAMWVRGAEASWLLGVPIGVVLTVSAPALVPLLYGDQWESSVPLLQILGLAVPPQLVGRTLGAGFQAAGLTDRQFILGLVNTAIIISAIALGLSWGATGVAIGVTGAMYLTTGIGARSLLRSLSEPFLSLLKALMPGSVAGALGLGAGIGVVNLLPIGTTLYLELLAGATCVAITYGATVLWLRPNLARDIRSFGRSNDR